MAFGMDAMSEYQPATRRAPMTVAIVSTYPPRPCGIAVFSGDLRNAMLGADSSVDVEIVAMVRDGESAGSPHVVRTIRQGVAADYAAAAADLNRRRRRRADRARVRHLRRRGRLSRAASWPTGSRCRSSSPCTRCWPSRPRRSPAPCERCANAPPASWCSPRRPGGWSCPKGSADPDRVRVVPHGAPDVLSEMAWADSVSDQSPPGVLAVGDQALPISRTRPCCRPSA